MIDSKKCISCGACLEVCPVEAIFWDENRKAKIDPSKCIKCHACEGVCPVGAIEIKD